MKTKNVIILLVILLSVLFLSNCKSNSGLFSKKENESKTLKSDSIYNEEMIITIFADIINDSLQTNRNRTFAMCRLEGMSPVGFFIYDLVDTTNNTINNNGIAFINKHIYHFSSWEYRFSYSNICVLDGEEIVIFRNVNCTQSNENIEDVIEYVSKIYNDESIDDIINRLTNLKKYSHWFRVDPQTRRPEGCR